ncbi:DUF5979 domain-containing protein [Corynebacterium kutscheri]|uniref:LPxTG domain-containing protein n=1 Tax=Corynebacterium kutscheri TaxID=35755 RepID=A0AB38VPG0_9CORY|nr:DUF5979 domain-containing protein [Corynebacterium kutscheri]VEH04532.1 LPxTG domain-containing protein [Corynebacterium kutscheri]
MRTKLIRRIKYERGNFSSPAQRAGRKFLAAASAITLALSTLTFSNAQASAAEEDTGSFVLNKIVKGPNKAGHENEASILRWICVMEGNRNLRYGYITLTRNEAVTTSEIPLGSKCTLFEHTTAEDVKWKIDGVDTPKGEVFNEISFTITQEKPQVKITTTNVYNGNKTTGFSLKKVVDGNIDPKHTFTFNWECSNNGSNKKGEVALTSNQEKTIEGITLGSSCTVTEKEETAKIKGYDHELTWMIQEGTDAKPRNHTPHMSFIADDAPQDIRLTATNKYISNGESKPQEPKTCSSSSGSSSGILKFFGFC